jgi:hypothetical protein
MKIITIVRVAYEGALLGIKFESRVDIEEEGRKKDKRQKGFASSGGGKLSLLNP